MVNRYRLSVADIRNQLEALTPEQRQHESDFYKWEQRHMDDARKLVETDFFSDEEREDIRPLLTTVEEFNELPTEVRASLSQAMSAADSAVRGGVTPVNSVEDLMRMLGL